MAHTRWDRRFFESTRGRVVSLLRWRRHTVEELAGALDVTDNAVRSHLAVLERDGIVRQQGVRRGVGKPAYDYELTAEAEHLFPKAYEPVLRGLLSVLAERMTPAAVDDILTATGRRLASGLPAPDQDVSTRLDAAVKLINDLGGLAAVEETDSGYTIQGYSCPLISIVPEHPDICRLVGALLADITDTTVCERCDRGERPRCRFVIDLSDRPAVAGIA
jgi:predicted ArsR family transcriptional regulator